MDDFDLYDECNAEEELNDTDKEKLANFNKNLELIDKLWRLADEKEPNYFFLKTRKGNLEDSISLLELLPDFIEKNIDEAFDESDLFFAHQIKDKMKRKLEHIPKLLNFKSLYLSAVKLKQKAISNPVFLQKIHYIKVSPKRAGQKENTCSNHWDLVYVDPCYHQDNDIIELLDSCSTISQRLVDEAYLRSLFSRTLYKDDGVKQAV